MSPNTISFRSDNDWGASPAVISAIASCNALTARPYGADDWTRAVEAQLCEVCERQVGVLLRHLGVDDMRRLGPVPEEVWERRLR